MEISKGPVDWFTGTVRIDSLFKQCARLRHRRQGYV